MWQRSPATESCSGIEIPYKDAAYTVLPDRNGLGLLPGEDCAATGATHTENSNGRTRRRECTQNPPQFTNTTAPVIIAPML